MTKHILAILGLLVLGSSAAAQVVIRNSDDIQSATVAIFATSATNPNVDSPVATPVVYTTFSCKMALGTEPNPITDPNVGFFEWPTNSGQECSFNIASQINALSAGTYKGAIKLDNQPYDSVFSTNFTVP